MTHLLHIDCSPRELDSVSRQLSEAFVAAWQQGCPGRSTTYRDLGTHPVPPIDAEWIVGAYTPPDRHLPETEVAIALSNRLVDELCSADMIVVGLPMYNFTVPAQFKAYIDQVVRMGRTFDRDAQGNYRGLVPPGKRAIVIVTSGGSYRPGTPSAALDFLTPYVRHIFELIGIREIQFVWADHLGCGGEVRHRAIAAAHEALMGLLRQRV